VTLLRIPPGLRVQAMTAESTLSTTAGLLALALAGPALETLGTTRSWPGWPPWPRPPP
jgi:hypothetical protein